MICNKCKAEFADNAEFCPVCGVKLKDGDVANRGRVFDLFKEIFSDNLFMILTAIVGLKGVLDFLDEGLISAAVCIISAVLMWTLYSAATKGRLLDAYVTPLKTLKVLANINFVITRVVWIIIAVTGAVVLLIHFFYDGQIFDSNEYYEIFDGLKFIPTQWAVPAIGVGILLAALVLMVINRFYYSNLLKLSESFYESAKNDSLNLKKVSTVKKWLVVMSAYELVSDAAMLTSMDALSIVIALFNIAVYMTAFVWLNKLVENLQ